MTENIDKFDRLANQVDIILLSVIVPLYFGNKFIKNMIKQVEGAYEFCLRTASGDKKIELIFVNDSPDETIDEIYSDVISVRYIGGDANRGIQGARIYALSQARGEYIHFLDQDDEIDSTFYSKLIPLMKENDVAYCRCLDGMRPTYTYDRVFETSADEENILVRPAMISPGQAIIRKSSIPQFWKENILKQKGSDDYFLWLCMFATGCKFGRYDEVLFRHVRTGGNFSSDIWHANRSDKEMIDLLLESGLFSDEQREKLKQIPDKQFNRKYKAMLRSQTILYVLEILLQAKEFDYGIDTVLKSEGIESVAIYGAGIMGERVKDLLQDSGMKVMYYVDKNAPFIRQDIEVITLDDMGKRVDIPDAVVISFVDEEDGILQNLRALSSDMKVLTVRQIAQQIYDYMERAKQDRDTRWNDIYKGAPHPTGDL